MPRADAMALFSARRLIATRPSAKRVRRWLQHLEHWQGDVRRFYPWPALEASLAADIAVLNDYLKERPHER